MQNITKYVEYAEYTDGTPLEDYEIDEFNDKSQKSIEKSFRTCFSTILKLLSTFILTSLKTLSIKLSYLFKYFIL